MCIYLDDVLRDSTPETRIAEFNIYLYTHTCTHTYAGVDPVDMCIKVCMYVQIRRHQHTRVHAHTGPRRHARAPACRRHHIPRLVRRQAFHTDHGLTRVYSTKGTRAHTHRKLISGGASRASKGQEALCPPVLKACRRRKRQGVDTWSLQNIRSR